MPVASDQDKQAKSATGSGVVTDDRYPLLIDHRLPELDLGDAKAFMVCDDRSPNDLLFARVCPPHGMPRLDVVNGLKHMRDAKLLRLVEWGPVNLSESSKSQVAIIFQRPTHGVLLPPDVKSINPNQTDEIAKYVMLPACQTLALMPGAIAVFRSLNATRRVYVLREQQK